MSLLVPRPPLSMNVAARAALNAPLMSGIFCRRGTGPERVSPQNLTVRKSQLVGVFLWSAQRLRCGRTPHGIYLRHALTWIKQFKDPGGFPSRARPSGQAIASVQLFAVPRPCQAICTTPFNTFNMIQEEAYLRLICPAADDIPGCIGLFDTYLSCSVIRSQLKSIYPTARMFPEAGGFQVLLDAQGSAPG